MDNENKPGRERLLEVFNHPEQFPVAGISQGKGKGTGRGTGRRPPWAVNRSVGASPWQEKEAERRSLSRPPPATTTKYPAFPPLPPNLPFPKYPPGFLEAFEARRRQGPPASPIPERGRSPAVKRFDDKAEAIRNKKKGIGDESSSSPSPEGPVTLAAEANLIRSPTTARKKKELRTRTRKRVRDEF